MVTFTLCMQTNANSHGQTGSPPTRWLGHVSAALVAHRRPKNSTFGEIKGVCKGKYLTLCVHRLGHSTPFCEKILFLFLLSFVPFVFFFFFRNYIFQVPTHRHFGYLSGMYRMLTWYVSKTFVVPSRFHTWNLKVVTLNCIINDPVHTVNVPGYLLACNNSTTICYVQGTYNVPTVTVSSV